MCINNASLFLAYQSINWWQNSVQWYFIKIEWWQSFHYIYQLHCIWQSLVFEVITYSLCNTWFVYDGAGVMIYWVGNTIHDTIMLRIYVHHGAPFCVLTVKRHCLPLTRLPRVAGGAPAVNHKATAIWFALLILAGNEHCNVCDGNMVSEYTFNFLWPFMNGCIQNMFVAFVTICSVSMPNFTSI